MPPKKIVDPAKAATGDEGTPAKEVSGREGVNIEVDEFPELLKKEKRKTASPARWWGGGQELG
jgi:hypothetical protein